MSTKLHTLKKDELITIINKQQATFDKLVNKEFIQDLQETKKENRNKDFLLRNYFEKQFILTVFQEQKRIYTFKSILEKMIFDSMYFMFKNKDAKNIYQCEYTDDTEKHIRIAICTENMKPEQIEYFNKRYDLNIPPNAQMQKKYDWQDQQDVDFSVF